MKMKLSKPILCFILFQTAAYSQTADNVKSKKWSQRLFPGHVYSNLLERNSNTRETLINQQADTSAVKELTSAGVPISDLVPPSVGVYREYEEAEAFLQELDTPEGPAFVEYASLNVDSNPVAVLWSQAILRYQGNQTLRSVPRDFRSLLLLADIVYPEWPTHLADNGVQYVDADLQKTIAHEFLESARNLSSRNFGYPYYDSIFACHSYEIFWDAICGYLSMMLEYDKAYAGDYLRDLVLLKMEISRALWDEKWVVQLQQGCPESSHWRGPAADVLSLAALTMQDDTDLALHVKQAVRKLSERLVAPDVSLSYVRDVLEKKRYYEKLLYTLGCVDESPLASGHCRLPVRVLLDMQAYQEERKNLERARPDLPGMRKRYIEAYKPCYDKLISPQGVDLYTYVDYPLGQNPYTVMAGAFFLSLIDGETLYPVPDDYLLINFYQSLYNILQAEYRAGYFGYMLEYYRRLPADIFLYPFPGGMDEETPPSAGMPSGRYFSFWRNLRKTLKDASTVCHEEALSFITDLMLCRLGISRPVWDASYADKLVADFIGTDAGEVADRMAYLNRELVKNHYNSTSDYRFIYSQTMNVLSNRSSDIFASAYDLLGSDGVTNQYVLQFADDLSDAMGSFRNYALLYDMDWTVMPPDERTELYFAKIAESTVPPFDEQLCNQFSDRLVTADGCLDHDALRYMWAYPECVDATFWNRWYAVAHLEIQRISGGLNQVFRLFQSDPQRLNEQGKALVVDVTEKCNFIRDKLYK